MVNNLSRLGRRSAAVLVGAALAFALTTSAFAAIVFDPDTGEGTVGKGDIQQLLGLKNNAAAQAWYDANKNTVEFDFEHKAQYTYDCVGLDNKSEPATKDGKVNINVKAEADFLGRGQSNWAGFTLTGFDKQTGTTKKDVPEEGDECKEGNVTGEIENVQMEGKATLGLFMKWTSPNKDEVIIWQAEE